MKRLKAFMAFKGVSVKKLSELSEIPRTTLQKKLNGVREFRLSELRSISECLDMTPEDVYSVFFGSNEKW